MKIFVIGGVTVQSDHQDYNSQNRVLDESMEQIGGDVIAMGHDLVACSPFPGTADLAAIRGAAKAIHGLARPSPSIEIHCPAEPAVLSEVAKLTGSPPHTGFRVLTHPISPREDGEPNWEHTWLLSQLSALEASQAVLAVGGKPSGPANLLLSLAIVKSKPILLLAFLGGASAQCVERLRWLLDDVFKDRMSSLYQPDCAHLSVELLEELAVDRVGAPQRGDRPRIFISYPRKRPAEADHIEMTLRRRRLDVYRDEHDFGAGRDLPHEVRASIERSNVFIAVWCEEYACSPWCYDELELALKLHEEGKIEIWIFCVDGTRIVPPAARALLNFPSLTRDQTERHLLNLLESWNGVRPAN